MTNVNSVRAFTLIEVLIVMTLLSVMVVLLFGTLKISADSWEHGEDKIADVNEITVVYNFFQRHLLATKPMWDDFSEPESKVLGFQGNVQSLQFISSFPASVERPGAQRFTVKLQDQYEPLSIEVVISPFLPANEGEQLGQEQVTLVKDISHFEFAYFGENLETGQVEWQDHWLDRESLPQLVKVSIALNNGVYWPVMVFPLKITEVVNFDNIAGLSTTNEENNDEADKLDPDAENNSEEMDTGENP